MQLIRIAVVALAMLAIAAPAMARPAANRAATRTASPPVAVKIPENMTSQQLREQLIYTAYSQLGLSYMLGGVAPREGFDCSGYMRWVFAMADIQLPRTSGEQFNKGIAVDRANLVPGDLVFFRNGRRIGHVGLYVGYDYFIHSPNRRGEIMISKLSGQGWATTYAGARRIVPDKD